MRAIEKRILDFVALAIPVNDNPVVRPASQASVDALLAQLVAVKQVGKTDYEAPGKPPGRLIIQPSPAWRKMVTLG